MLIEEREKRQLDSAEKPSDEMFMMMDARLICHGGHEVAALTMYDNVATSLMPSSNRRCL
jgi:hypothetical protein